MTSHSAAICFKSLVGSTFGCIFVPRLIPVSRIDSTTLSSRAKSKTFRLAAMMFAMADPKLPAPITPTGLSDELFKIVAQQAVVIIVEQRELLRHNLPLLVPEQRPIQMEDTHVV